MHTANKKQSDPRQICKFCVVPLHGGGGLVLGYSTLLDSVYAVSSVLGSGVSCVQANYN